MKKKYILILAVSLTALTLLACNGKESGSSTLNFDKDASYALGMVYGSDIRSNIDSSGLVPDYGDFKKGFMDGLNAKKTRFELNEAMQIIEAAFNSFSEQRTAKMEQDEIDFLAGNSKNPGVIITPSGLQYEVKREGSGPKPSENSTVLVHYTGTYLDGSVFDSSRERGAPQDLNLSEVIPGWTEGLQLMSAGSHYILYIPSELGYGNEGLVNPMTGMQLIPPYATLIFDIELIEILN